MVDWVSVVISLLVLAWIVLFVVALGQIIRSPHLTETNRLLWIAIALIAPVLGTVIWFVVGRKRERVGR